MGDYKLGDVHGALYTAARWDSECWRGVVEMVVPTAAADTPEAEDGPSALRHFSDRSIIDGCLRYKSVYSRHFGF